MKLVPGTRILIANYGDAVHNYNIVQSYILGHFQSFTKDGELVIYSNDKGLLNSCLLRRVQIYLGKEVTPGNDPCYETGQEPG